MDTDEKSTLERKKMLSLAERTRDYCDLLVKQCDSWLSEEEGLKNLRERKRKEKSNKKSQRNCFFHHSINFQPRD